MKSGNSRQSILFHHVKNLALSSDARITLESRFQSGQIIGYRARKKKDRLATVFLKFSLRLITQRVLLRLRYWLSAIECFNTQDGWEVSRNLVPALALVNTSKNRTAIGPEVHPHGVAFVTRHGLPKNCEVAGFLWQSIAHGLPGFAAVP